MSFFATGFFGRGKPQPTPQVTVQTATQNHVFKPGQMTQVTLPRGAKIQSVIIGAGGAGGGGGGTWVTTSTSVMHGAGGSGYGQVLWEPEPQKYPDEWLAQYRGALAEAQHERELDALGFIEVK